MPDAPSQPPLSDLGRALMGTQPAAKSAGPWMPPTCEALQAMLPGYTIEKFLARGGMGAVYRGIQNSLGRVVAIKILPPELQLADENFAERFKQEARSMGKLNHPGIVAVYDSGEMADGTLYFVMEFIEGTDVAQMVAIQGRLHSEHAMAITAHVCDALQYAHEHGVIHRDIKPANIMVGYDGRVKVADFGLAKTSIAGETGLTRSGMVMGTMHFMAPEALTLGSAVDHRADIYAVGVMLYQMLTGRLPQGMFELPSMQVTGLDPRYDAIIATALRDDRSQRYQQISEMRHALDAILTQPVAKVEALAVDARVEVPAALPTQARPQRSPHQPYRPPQPRQQPQVVQVKKHGSSLIWIIVFALGAVAAWMYWERTKTKDDTTIASVPTPAQQSSTSAGGTPSTTAIKIDDAFMRANVLGTSWRTHYTNDSRYDTLEFKSTGNEVVKFASVGGQQQATWSIEEGGVALKVTTLDKSGFYFLINFTSNNTADIQFIKVKTISMVGMMSRIAIAKPVPAPSSATATAIIATKEAPFINSLGMKFVPVPIIGGPTAGKTVLFSIWETRVQDYRVFATEANHEWPNAGYPQTDTHPAVKVSWDDAQAFCLWLTEHERKAGKLGANESCRLPTDHEWSCAVGIGDKEDAAKLPAEKNEKIDSVFPSGTQWPPAASVGNYWSEEFRPFMETGRYKTLKGELTGRRDGYGMTAPVGSFPANQLGIFDLGGNVSEWCEDWFDAAHKKRVARGASWHDAEAHYGLSSSRGNFDSDFRGLVSGVGFRCVVEQASLQTKETKAPASPPTTSVPSTIPELPANGWRSLTTDGSRFKNSKDVSQTPDGWWHVKHGFLPLLEARDAAFRVHAKFREDGPLALICRWDGSATTSVHGYRATLNGLGKAGTAKVVNGTINTVETRGETILPHTTFPIGLQPQVTALSGEEYDLELRCAGNQIAVLVNGSLMNTTQQDAGTGTWLGIDLFRNAEIKTLEWMPLDPTGKPLATAPPASATNWIDTKGRNITATFKGIQGDNVLLEIAGKVTPVPMNTLSAESQKQARELPAQSKPALATNTSGKPLFNGTDLTGWVGNTTLWSVKDGAITGIVPGRGTVKNNTYLVWKGGKVADFELTLKYRLEGGNSGVNYRSKELPKTESGPLLSGYQVDLDATTNVDGMLYEEKGRGILAQRSGSPVVKRGDWNELKIIAKGNRLQHFINGTQTVDTTDSSAKSGVLALQLHQGPAMQVQFKDIVLSDSQMPSNAAPTSATLQPNRQALDRYDSSKFSTGLALFNFQLEPKVMRAAINSNVVPMLQDLYAASVSREVKLSRSSPGQNTEAPAWEAEMQRVASKSYPDGRVDPAQPDSIRKLREAYWKAAQEIDRRLDRLKK